MTGPIYKFWACKPTEAWYQLSEEEQNNHLAKLEEALQMAGGKRVLTCAPRWANEQWIACGVEEFPDIDAVYKHTELISELEHYRYIEGQSILGVKWPSS